MIAIPDPARRTAAQIEWEYATVIERNSSLVTVLSAQLGLDAATLDNLFLAGGTL